MLLSTYDGTSAPECAEMLRRSVQPGQPGTLFHCDLNMRGRKGASLDHGAPYRPYASQLWVVNFFASERKASKAEPGTWRSLYFDFEAAEAEIRRRRQVLDLDQVRESIMSEQVSDELRDQLLNMLTLEEADSDQPMSRLRERRERGIRRAPPNAGGLTPLVSRRSVRRDAYLCLASPWLWGATPEWCVRDVIILLVLGRGALASPREVPE